MCGPRASAPCGAAGAARGDAPVPDRRRDDPPRSTLEGTSWNELPGSSRPGRRRIAEAVGIGAAIDYLTDIGLEAIHEHEAAITAYGWSASRRSPASRCTGRRRRTRRRSCRSRSRACTPHDVAQILDSEGVCVRAGHHCTQPAMRRFDVVATTRASVLPLQHHRRSRSARRRDRQGQADVPGVSAARSRSDRSTTCRRWRW